MFSAAAMHFFIDSGCHEVARAGWLGLLSSVPAPRGRAFALQCVESNISVLFRCKIPYQVAYT